MRHPVMRQCVGCREVTDRENLVRCVYVAESDKVEVDMFRKLPGRGVWVHADPKCIKKGLRNRGFVRTLKLAEQGITALSSAEAMQQLTDDVLQCARCAL